MFSQQKGKMSHFTPTTLSCFLHMHGGKWGTHLGSVIGRSVACIFQDNKDLLLRNVTMLDRRLASLILSVLSLTVSALMDGVPHTTCELTTDKMRIC